MLQPIHSGRIEPRCDGERFASISQPRYSVSHDWWILKICEVLGSQRTSTIATARVMREAREELQGGEWSALWKDRRIPFSKRKGDMLVTIGRELGNLDEQNLAQLPIHWSVLYELALLGAAAVVRLIAEGVIHPGLSRREAAALRCKKSRDGGPSIEKAIRRLAEMVHRAGPGFSQTRRMACAALLRGLAADILVLETKEGKTI